MVASLAYLFWFVVAPLILMGSRRTDLYVRFHAWQALWFGGVMAGGWCAAVALLALVATRAPGVTLAGGGVPFVVLFVLLAVAFMGIFFLQCWYAVRAGRGEIFPALGVGERAGRSYRNSL